MSKRRLVLFTRFPESGKVKTRLIPVVGPAGAASLHRKMAEHSLDWAKSLAKRYPCHLEIRFDGENSQQMEDWLGADHVYVTQGEGDLGERMARAFQESFQIRNERVVLVGTDCPQLNVFLVQIAFDSLIDHDMVITPTADGGYCLLGLRQMVPELFQSINWGTDSVYKDSLERAKEKGLSIKALETLHDVDVPEDIHIWEKVSNQHLSIIIPTFNEEKNLQRTLEHLGQISHGEVIVADGGSQDETVRIAEEWGTKVVVSNPSRGGQMNAGASKASGDILLFLHADTFLPEDFLTLIRQFISNPEVAGGYFGWKVLPAFPLLKFIEKTVNWRTRIFVLPYGDQAFFVRASLFRQIGGYADISLMEDVEFIRRLKKIGKLIFISESVITSARLFQTRGVLRTTWKNKFIFFGYFLGIPPDRLAKIYYKKER